MKKDKYNCDYCKDEKIDIEAHKLALFQFPIPCPKCQLKDKYHPKATISFKGKYPSGSEPKFTKDQQEKVDKYCSKLFMDSILNYLTSNQVAQSPPTPE